MGIKFSQSYFVFHSRDVLLAVVYFIPPIHLPQNLTEKLSPKVLKVNLQIYKKSF